VQNISAALEAADVSLDLALSTTRKVHINLFKGKHLVDIREYYDKGGAPAPSVKGIALDASQWASLTAVLDVLHSHVHT
jgi:hypothetical protein